jgi:small ligand-binding sensory domain FIST
VRDRQGAQEDLVSHGTSYKRKQLAAMMTGASLPAPLGTLLFSCNGRGSNLFPEDPAFDARTVCRGASLNTLLMCPLIAWYFMGHSLHSNTTCS